ncbi:MAG: PepSY domain-containing protein [Methylophagaceae bacterium]
MKLFRYLVVMLALMLTFNVFAAHLPDDIEPGDGVNDIQLPLTKESAAELVRIENKGKVLSVDQTKAKGKKIFSIKVLHDNGKIKVYQLDSQTGHSPK